MAAAARNLLILFIPICFLTLNIVIASSGKHSSPSNNNDLADKDHHHKQPSKIFKSNQNETESAPAITTTTTTTSSNETFSLFPDEDFRNIFCTLKPAWPAEYGNDVVMLTGKNFSEFLGKHRHVLVFFYMYWCPPCQTMAAEYALAAKMLKGEAELAMVDAFVEEGLREKYNITEYPMVYLFVGGVKLYHFTTARTRDVISAWVRRKMALGTYSITTMDEAERLLAAESKFVLGFLDNLEGSESEELAAVSKLHSDINFYQTTNADVAELFHIDPKSKRPALIFLRTVAGKASMFSGQFTRLAITDFVSAINHPLVVTFTTGNAELIFQNPMKQLWLFAPAYSSEKLISAFEGVAKAFEGKLLFVYVETNSENVGKEVIHEFGITGNVPRVITYSTFDAKKYVLNGELTLSSIKSFVEDFLEEKLSSQSEKISETELKLPSHSRASYQLRSHM